MVSWGVTPLPAVSGAGKSSQRRPPSLNVGGGGLGTSRTHNAVPSAFSFLPGFVLPCSHQMPGDQGPDPGASCLCHPGLLPLTLWLSPSLPQALGPCLGLQFLPICLLGLPSPYRLAALESDLGFRPWLSHPAAV